MGKYISKLFFLLTVAASVISAYYGVGFHNEKTDGTFSYILIIGILYAAYKLIKHSLSRDKIVFTPAGIIGYTILHIFIISLMFFSLNEGSTMSLVLFFKIIGFLILPSLITLVFYSGADKILNYIPTFKQEKSQFKFTMSLGFGFVILSTLITIFGSLGFYNFTMISLITFVVGAFANKEIIANLGNLWNYKIEFLTGDKNDDFIKFINFPLLTAELSFIVLTFLIGVNFVNIIRPMPIGWDDLGAYMNYPKMIAASGGILDGAGIMAWQTITGIGFTIHSSTQAFFFNQLGGILSIVVLIVVFSDLLNNGKKRLLSLPIILATIFYSMPMVIFQQAKDMKLDPGLFFVSVIGIYLIYSLFSRYLGYEDLPNTKKENKDIIEVFHTENNLSYYLNKFSSVFKSSSGESRIFEYKEIWIYLFIIGMIVGLAFAIKFTTLMLILGLLGVIFYSKLGFSGFIAYFLMFIGIFTRLKLWDYLNINYPKDNISLLNNFAYISIALSICFFGYSLIKYGIKSFQTVFLLIIIFSTGILATLSPWLIKNISEIKEAKLSIGTMLGGESKSFKPDYTKLYSSDELTKIEQKNKYEAMSSSGKASNEDLGRYFGYEDGINNYLKLPYNLTMQSNQNGEYTELTYIFLALLPAILIFLYFKREYFILPLIIFIFFGYLYFPYKENYLPESEIKGIPKNISSELFRKNDSIFNHSIFTDNIYDINSNMYISDDKQVELFYNDIKNSIVSCSINKTACSINKELSQQDQEFLKKLIYNYDSNVIFNIKSFNDIKKFKLDKKLENQILIIWKKYNSFNQKLVDFFALQTLPGGYLWIILGFIIILAYFLYSLANDKLSQIFKINAVFATIYVLIFVIAAYGIVWYGISMYFAFLLMIGIAAAYLSELDGDESMDIIKLFGSFVFVLLVFMYFGKSSIPHGINNLKAASFIEYKNGSLNQEEAIFTSHPDYFAILAELNLKNQEEISSKLISGIQDDMLKKIITANSGNKINLTKLESILREITNSDLTKLGIPEEVQIKTKLEAKDILNKAYNVVLYPSKDQKNEKLIYRIGTFLTYFISDNRIRYYDDSLVTLFGTYFADNNPDIAIERMQKLGLKYLLVDLNAATIDKDPRHDLTRRYEQLLNSFKSDKLELIQTDSICLRIALEEKNENYMEIAGVNYESYDKDGKQINRGQKQIACYNHILDLMKTGKITDTSYSYLKPMAQYFQANKITDQNKALQVFQQYVNHGWMAFFRIK